MFKRFDFKRALRSRKLLIAGLIIVALLIGLAGGMGVAAHNSQGSALTPTYPVASVVGDKAAAASANIGPTAAVSDTQTNETTSNNTSTTKSSHPSIAAQTTTTHTTAPTAPAQPQYNITFSADGCYVTATGTPGLILSGAVHDALNKKGGPMGAPAGIAIPASGTVTEGIGAGVGTAQDISVADAVLKDSQGNVVLSKSGSITSPSCTD